MWPMLPTSRPLYRPSTHWASSSMTVRLCLAAKCVIGSRSGDNPYNATGMTALLREEMQLSTLLGSRLKVRGSMSAKTGIAPACSTANEVLDIVRGGTITSSPEPTPAATSAECSVAVPLICAMAYLTWNISANFCSNRWVIKEPAELRNCESSTCCTNNLSRSVTLIFVLKRSLQRK